MTEVVVEIGPGTIRGANDARPELISVALDYVDDDIALLADRPVTVQQVWDDLMSVVVGSEVDTAVLVCPAWWSSARLQRARQAACNAATDVVVLERIALLRQGIPVEDSVVEIAPDIVVVTAFGTITAVVPRGEEPVATADAVVTAVGVAAGVVVDAPAAVFGADALASMIMSRLRAIGVPARILDDDWVQRAATAQPTDVVVQGNFRHRRPLAVLSGLLLTLAVAGGFVAAHDSGSGSRVDNMPMTLLVEGRVGVMVPATWTARRITSGPGSARVQVVSPTDGDIAVHITQSLAPFPSTLAQTADSLRTAMAEGVDGAFVEFNPSDHRAGRSAVTYREIRQERRIEWAVVVDGAVRIAIGCQSTLGREHLIRDACDRAIRSAHAVR
ncbi:type VII secretion-associated protein [Mycobacterium barrassiae]|uniref:type VII secretion-associated protein n=1 Tax=Mycobacterium barrassiae TaxID=319709 RepID=UPI002265E3E2|nr:type VII secretion-associated protein [Mycobacterium barrassiae]MCV7302424.1 type VII secretion-associated protein [Mycobacterium barrassiae]